MSEDSLGLISLGSWGCAVCSSWGAWGSWDLGASWCSDMVGPRVLVRRMCGGRAGMSYAEGVGDTREGNSVVLPTASLQPAAARYPTHDSKSALLMGHSADK